MDDIVSLIVLFVAGLLAGVINVVSGGGSSLTLPALTFSGLDAATANGTNRIGVLLQTVSAIVVFRKHSELDWKLSLKLAFLTVPGAVLGAFYSVQLGDREFKIILGVIILCIAILLLTPMKQEIEGERSVELTPFRVIMILLVGLYGGFIQVGVGFIIMLFLSRSMNMNLIEINFHKVVIVFVYTIPALIIFASQGYIDYISGLVLSVGTVIGAWGSAKTSLVRGESFVKKILLVSLFIISMKLFGLFDIIL
jgi:uncharacterized membrane protein YfcA